MSEGRTLITAFHVLPPMFLCMSDIAVVSWLLTFIAVGEMEAILFLVPLPLRIT